MKETLYKLKKCRSIKDGGFHLYTPFMMVIFFNILAVITSDVKMLSQIFQFICFYHMLVSFGRFYIFATDGKYLWNLSESVAGIAQAEIKNEREVPTILNHPSIKPFISPIQSILSNGLGSIMTRYGMLKNCAYNANNEFSRCYPPLFLKTPDLMMKMDWGNYLLKGSCQIDHFFATELEKYGNSHKKPKQKEKQRILKGYIEDRGHGLDTPDLHRIYHIPETLWNTSNHPIIKNLQNARYLHHEDPDIMRALEIIKMESNQ